MRKLVFITVVVLAGCAAPSSQWKKPGTTAQDLADDTVSCEAKVEGMYPVNMQFRPSAGWETPPRRECTGPQREVCVNIPGVPARAKEMDVNAAPRKKGTEACMKALGWSK